MYSPSLLCLLPMTFSSPAETFFFPLENADYLQQNGYLLLPDFLVYFGLSILRNHLVKIVMKRLRKDAAPHLWDSTTF